MKALLRPFFGKSAPPAQEEAFLKMLGTYERRMENWPPLAPANEAGKVAVLITPWLFTPVPFFSLELARTLAEAGCKVVALFDCSDVVGNSRRPGHERALESLLHKARGWLEVRPFTPLPARPEDLALGKTLARANAVRFMRSEALAKDFHQRQPQAAAKIAAHFRGVLSLLEREKPRRLLVPGGVWGLSGGYVEAARRLGIPFQTFDSGPGILRLCQNGIASHLADIPAAFFVLAAQAEADPALREKIRDLARQEFDDRTQCRDFRHFQTVPRSGNPKFACDLLVPLNISWDTAALALPSPFSSMREWLHHLLEWLARRPGYTLCLRQHPRERLAFVRSQDDFSDLVENFPSLRGRVHYVRAEDRVSSYDLLEQARVVLPHSSTFGIEAAYAGKPVVVATKCYYADLGFVSWKPDATSYFEAIEKILQEKPSASVAERDKAGIAYFLTQRCAYLKTHFTPQPDDFAKWCAIPREELWSDENLSDFRSALLSGEPLSLLQARRLISSGS